MVATMELIRFNFNLSTTFLCGNVKFYH